MNQEVLILLKLKSDQKLNNVNDRNHGEGLKPVNLTRISVSVSESELVNFHLLLLYAFLSFLVQFSLSFQLHCKLLSL